MNRRIRRLGVALVVLFGLLFLQISYLQVFAAERIANNPANAARQIIAEYRVDRGRDPLRPTAWCSRRATRPPGTRPSCISGATRTAPCSRA